MQRIGKGALIAGLLGGLLMGATAAHATVINSGTSLCSGSVGVTGVGDIDWDIWGVMTIKASGDRDVVCTLPREPLPGSFTRVWFIDGFNSGGKKVTVTLVATNSDGTPLGSFAPSSLPGDGAFDLGVAVPPAAMPAFGYMSAFLRIPASGKGGVRGFASPTN